jgi:hypothetical protein
MQSQMHGVVVAGFANRQAARVVEAFQCVRRNVDLRVHVVDIIGTRPGDSFFQRHLASQVNADSITQTHWLTLSLSVHVLSNITMDDRTWNNSITPGATGQPDK